MSVFRVGLAHMFRWSAFGFILMFIASLFIEDMEQISPTLKAWYLIPIAIVLFALSVYIQPTIEVDNDGNAIPKRK
jgi:uncharacterized membrane protein